MRTDTKSKIIKIIEEKGSTSPSELARLLNISAQALHRQLKKLVIEEVLVTQGSSPSTRYALAGVPEFSKAFAWVSSQVIKKNPTETVSETRDIFAGRLSPLRLLIKEGLDAENLPLLISIIGEIGNNSFDHNLGQWKDVPGCWFETQVTGGKLWVLIADRGQGIFSTLLRTDPKISNEQSAIESAFEKFISGRAHERRGNGLKFVKKTILQGSNQGLACVSGKGRIHFGDWGESCEQLLKKSLPKVKGTATLIVWSLK